MTLLYQSPVFEDHNTGQHPECASRVRHIAALLRETRLDARCQTPQWSQVEQDRLARVHDLNYVARVRRFAEGGGGYLEADTALSPESYQVALSAAGAICDATTRVLSGEAKRALCLLRPPGHHACHHNAMGFCLFNNVAVATRLALDRFDVERVLIVDWDVHHGNGTQDAFWNDPQVGFLSIHRWPFYPGTGDRDEVGAGRGLGTVRNLPIRFGTSRNDYLAQFTTELESFADKMRPQLVMISAGFDSHRKDPIGSLGLETEDFTTLSNVVLDVADQHAEGRVISTLEGGYHLAMLSESVAVHLAALLARDERDGARDD